MNKELRQEQYTIPKIYSGKKKFDYTDRWYVYYNYLNPETNQMKRQNPIYLDLNKKYKTRRERFKQYSYLRNVVEDLLRDGYSPYKQAKKVAIEVHTAKCIILQALNGKKTDVSEKTFKDYKSKIIVFLSYLEEKSLDYCPIQDITRKHVAEFLDTKEKETSSTTRNGYMRVLSSIYEQLVVDSVVGSNIIKTFRLKKEEHHMNATYNDDDAKGISEYLKSNDMPFYILQRLISLNLLRPIEACRLQVKDINLDKGYLEVQTKTKKRIKKTIPKLMLDELKTFDLSNPEAYLVTKNGIAETKVNADNRRKYFTKRFQKLRITLGLDKHQTLYAFRHTSITHIFRQLKEDFGKKEALDKLMEITGHTTLDGLLNYLRDVDLDRCDDYSHLLDS